MKVIVTKEAVVITEYSCINEGEVCVNTCYFDLPECFEGLSVTAAFNNIPVPVTDNQCNIPSLKKGTVTLGVYAYREDENGVTLMYSPKPTVFYVNVGSYSEEIGVEETPTVTEFEQYCRSFSAEMQNLLVDTEKISNKVTEITEESTDEQYPSAKAVYDVINENIHGVKVLSSSDFVNGSFAAGTGFTENSYSLGTHTPISVKAGDKITVKPNGFSVWVAVVNENQIDTETIIVESLPSKTEVFEHSFEKDGWLYIQVVKLTVDNKWSSVTPKDYNCEIDVTAKDESGAEIQNIRNGADGTVYSSAGEAVRKQVSDSQGIRFLLSSDFINGQFKVGVGIEAYDLWLVTEKSIPVSRGDRIIIKPNDLRVWVLLHNNSDPTLVTRNETLYLGTENKELIIEKDGCLCIQIGQSGTNQGKPINIYDYVCCISIGKTLKEKVEEDIQSFKEFKKDVAQSSLRGSSNGEFVLIDDGVKFTQPMSCKVTMPDGASNATLRSSGKNLLSYPYYDKSKTTNGVTFTVNDDGTVSTSGTATGGNAIFDLAFGSEIHIPKDVAIVVSGSPAGKGFSTYIISVETELRDGSSLFMVDFGSNYTSNSVKTIKSAKIVIYEGTNAEGLIFKPQIEIGTVATEYEQPQNVDIVSVEAGSAIVSSKNPITVILCNIDGVNITCEYAKNLNKAEIYSIDEISKRLKFDDNVGNRLFTDISLDYSKFQDGYLNTNGTSVIESVNYKYSDYIEVQERREISLKNGATLGQSKVFFYDDNKRMIGRVVDPIYSAVNPETIFTTPFNTKYIRFGISATQLGKVSVSYTKEDDKSYWLNDLVNGWYSSAYKRIGNLFGNEVRKPLITVIDDDTTSIAAVQRFYEYCTDNDIVGTYATLTDILNRVEGLPQQLLEYEKEGFHICFHGWKQSSFYTMSGYDKAGAENDFVTGYQDMTKYGFSDWKFWCTPYGQSFPATQNLARKWGMQCLVRSTAAHEEGLIETTEAKNGRWSLYRVGMHSHDDGSNVPTLTELKILVDETVAKGGWLLINTHMQYDGTSDSTVEDWTTEEAKSRFAEFVTYAKNSGCTFTTLNEAWRIKEPIYRLYELFN